MDRSWFSDDPNPVGKIEIRFTDKVISVSVQMSRRHLKLRRAYK